MNKDQLLKSLEYLKDLKPSEWRIDIVTRFKVKVLDDLIAFVKGEEIDPPEPEKKDIVETAEEIFESKAK